MAQNFGIYLNKVDHKVFRIGSPYWLPSGPEWEVLTTDVNATLLRARELAGKKSVANPENITWGEYPKA